jgi:hypothetical protein
MRPPWNVVLPVLLAACGLLASAALLHAGHALDGFLFNSDAMYLPTLFADVVGGDGELDHWYLTPAPYFFPDYPLFLLAYLATPVPFLQISVYALLQAALTLLLLVCLARCMPLKPAWPAALLTWSCLLWLAHQAHEPFVFLLISGYHFGALLGGLALVALWFSHLQSRLRWRSPALLAACVLAAVVTLSDQLFLVQAAAPLVATAWLHALGDAARGPRLAVQAAAVGASAVLGSLVYPAVVEHAMRFQVQMGLGRWQANLQALSAMVRAIVASQPLYAGVGMVFVLLLVMALLRFRGQRTMRTSASRPDWLLVFAALSILSTWSAALLSESHPFNPRYLIGMGVWPIVAVGLWLAQRYPRGFVPWAAAATSMLLLSLGLQAGQRIGEHGVRLRQYPDDVACIDQALQGQDARHGIAGYWDAKQVQNLSRHRLRIAQYFDDLVEMRWITSADAYADSYDFAIISRNDDGKASPLLARLLELNGPPASQAVCGKRTLLVYGRNRLRTVPRLQLPGDRGRWNGCALSTRIGVATPACILAKREPSLQGFLGFGPYVPLPAGSYRAQLHYTSPAAAHTRIGYWDVAVGQDHRLDVLGQAPLPGSDAQAAIVSQDFVISPAQAAGLVEVRSVAESEDDLAVSAVTIERLR